MSDKLLQDWFEKFYNIVDGEQNSNEWEAYKTSIEKKTLNHKFTKKKNNTRVPVNSTSINEFNDCAPNHLSNKSLQNFEKFNFKTKKNLARNRLRIQATIDLHSLSIANAKRAVYEFINNSFQNKFKYLLIITGKGEIDGKNSTLRSEFRNFMHQDDVGDKVVSYTFASRQHGDFGAYYIDLKKNIS